ncbi:MAG: DUF190 domain-containing protein [Acidimicrobiales bacterium]
MAFEEVGTRLVVFLTEDDRAGHIAVHEALLERAREDGMAGATLWRGIEGFGSSGRLRTTRFPDMASGLPVAVEVIDLPERVESFLSAVNEFAPGALVTREQVVMTRLGRPAPAALDDPGPPRSQRTRHA